jgi:tetratricopeptide (TPR) repeat protein
VGHYNLGTALLEKGRLDEAIACYHQAIRLEGDPDHRKAMVPAAYTNLGNALRKQGKLDEAIASYRKAIELDPKAPGVHNILVHLALALNRQGKKSEARQIHEKEIAYLRAALHTDPKNGANRRLLRDHYRQLADNAPFTHDELAKVAEEFPRILPGEPDECVRAAWYLCRCVSRVEKDDKLREDERTKLAQRYAGRAVEMLRHSISKGNKDANRLKTDSAFAPLRAREDFQQLVAELAAKNK